MFEDLKPQSKSKKLESKKLEIGERSPEDIFAAVENKNKPFLKGVDKTKKADDDKNNNSNKKKFIFIGASVWVVIIITMFFILINKIDSFGFSRMFVFDEKEEREEGEEGIEREEGEQKLDMPAQAGIGNWKLREEEKENSGGDKAEIGNLKSEIIDSDSDGLSNEDEAHLGTDKDKIDTDDDGLSDREEIMVYKTDPLNQDSDQDGYFDGAEIKAGYNPKGSGKLIEL